MGFRVQGFGVRGKGLQESARRSEEVAGGVGKCRVVGIYWLLKEPMFESGYSYFRKIFFKNRVLKCREGGVGKCREGGVGKCRDGRVGKCREGGVWKCREGGEMKCREGVV